MTAYLFALIRVDDQARYAAEYAPRMQATLDPYGGRYLTPAAPFELREGAIAPQDHIVLIAFPDIGAARAWYESDAYAPLLQVRRETATTVLGFVEARAPS